MTTVFINDEFDGTVGQTLQAYSANWIAHPSSAGNSIIADAAAYRGKAAKNSAQNNSLYRNAIEPPQADYKVTGVIGRDAAGSAPYYGVCARMSAAANTFYMARFAGNEGQIQLYRFVSGTATLLGQAAASLALQTLSALTLEVIGSAIKVYWGGSATPILSVTDTQISAAGFVGIRLNGAQCAMDRFTASYESGGTTPVHNDLDASYAIQGPVSSDLSASYAIRSAVYSDLSASYEIRSSASSDLSATYQIRGGVSSDLAASYLVRASAYADLAAEYQIGGGVFGDLDASYLIRASASRDLASEYVIRSSVDQDLTCSYDIHTDSAVWSDLSASYVVRSAASSDLVASYEVRSAVFADSENAFIIRGLVSSDLEASYQISGALYPVYSDLQASYYIDGVAPTFIRSIFYAAVPEERFGVKVPDKLFGAPVPPGNFRASAPWENQ